MTLSMFEYHRMRERELRALAEAADSPLGREVHLDMAEQHAEKAKAARAAEALGTRKGPI